MKRNVTIMPVVLNNQKVNLLVETKYLKSILRKAEKEDKTNSFRIIGVIIIVELLLLIFVLIANRRKRKNTSSDEASMEDKE